MTISNSELSDITTDSTSRIHIWEKVLSLTGAKKIAELGVWKGDFASELLSRLPLISHYYMIDPWAKLPDWNKPFNVPAEIFDEIYSEALNKTAFASHKRIILRGRTKDVIDQIPDESLDFAYIDGDHTLRGITVDLIRILPKIKPGGLIGGDDFTNNPWQHSLEFEPTLVCPFSIYFCEAMDLPITALPYNQFLIRKSPAEHFDFTDLTGQYHDVSLNKFLSPPVVKQRGNVLTRWYKNKFSQSH
ncbi:MAG: class I SAM-dependent methyltransferase [Desulfobulbaceae bacterium]|nr:class I SAM-dependent methyltransferase [Desulfobulbaceae bacterium]